MNILLNKENKLIALFLIVMVIVISLVYFVEVIKSEEIVFKDELVVKTSEGYDFKLNEKTIKLTDKEYEQLYLYQGDKYKITYKYNRFSSKNLKIIDTEYIYK